MLFTTIVSFFFSSRRRHTRSLCDWSSDVCSSDLDLHPTATGRNSDFPGDEGPGRDGAQPMERSVPKLQHQIRSEERRVGKECRSRWSWYYKQNKDNSVVVCTTITSQSSVVHTQ